MPIITKIVEKSILTPVKIVCSRCGKEGDPENTDWWLIEKIGGYYSGYPGDLQKATCELCDCCVKKILGRYCEISDTAPDLKTGVAVSLIKKNGV